MHYAEHHDYIFSHNGDYSGDILITTPEGEKFTRTFADLAHVIYVGAYAMDQPQVKAFREFVAWAAIDEAISNLEQMDTDDALTNPYLIGILQEKIRVENKE